MFWQKVFQLRKLSKRRGPTGRFRWNKKYIVSIFPFVLPVLQYIVSIFPFAILVLQYGEDGWTICGRGDRYAGNVEGGTKSNTTDCHEILKGFPYEIFEILKLLLKLFF